jgi:hypothetical protein
MTSVFPVSPLESVREGMTIVDAQNRPLGTVTHVFPGSPNAVTTNENDLASGQVGMIIAPLENTGGTSTVGVAFPWVVDGMLNDTELPDELRARAFAHWIRGTRWARCARSGSVHSRRSD